MANIREILRFVDDFLVVYRDNEVKHKVLAAFEKNKLSLEFTTEEMDSEGRLQFLDILVIPGKFGVCWRNAQRMKKQVLPWKSSHSKSIKVGVVKGMIRSAIFKSCSHQIQRSIEGQVVRLVDAEYNLDFIEHQMKQLAMSFGREKKLFEKDCAIVAIQFVHNSGHRLKDLAEKFGVLVVFRYGNKLSSLPARLSRKEEKCGKSGHSDVVECSNNLVYNIPLSCGASYIGQTKRCLNKRLYEHQQAGRRREGGCFSTLADHLKICGGCFPDFSCTQVLARHGKKRVREVLEAAHILSGGDSVISKTSLVLKSDQVKYVLRK